MNKPAYRKLMEKAIAVMRQSLAEPRADGKASPKVGAVLLKPDGRIDTASRGELRHGDHAEFTLLERKNRSNKLDGGVLFVTLEPCAPNSRRHPKLPCAERIVLARIREVWVGVADPDPTVDRKGIKFLQDAGVKVEMFDRDLQEVIRSEIPISCPDTRRQKRKKQYPDKYPDIVSGYSTPKAQKGVSGQVSGHPRQTPMVIVNFGTLLMMIALLLLALVLRMTTVVWMLMIAVSLVFQAPPVRTIIGMLIKVPQEP